MLHTVKRAIIMAAGIGKRLQPLTFHTPKPLVRVNGERIIDTVISALQINGITEIYIVVGHLKEQFYEWAKDKPIKLIVNPYYEHSNNISSLYVARDYLKDCIVLDGDQIIYNEAVLNPHFSLSGYNAVWCQGTTKEWLMTVSNGIVRSCSRTGGQCGWQLYSISRWTTEDGVKLGQYVEQEFEKGNDQIYWDDVAMFLHFKDFKLGIFPMKNDDVIEIDSLEELVVYDCSYQKYKQE